MKFESFFWRRKKMFCWKNNENYDKVKKKNFVKEIEFLKKSNDEKGHVFELLFSDGLYNFCSEK